MLGSPTGTAIENEVNPRLAHQRGIRSRNEVLPLSGSRFRVVLDARG